MAEGRQTNDWQSQMPTISECNKYMWEHKLACDITFLVGITRTKIQAHKYVLMARSSVFFAMFAGLLADNKEKVEIPDIEEETFNTFMKHMYCDEVNLTGDTVLPLLYCAKKYNVQNLISNCLNVLKKNMSTANICVIMESAHTFVDEELFKRCLKKILLEPIPVFNEDSISELCTECLIKIIQDNSLPAKEEQVFEAVLRYAKNKCKSLGKQLVPENLRQVLGDAIKYVRFPVMSSEFFSDVVEPSGILTDHESLKLYRYFARNKQGDCGGFDRRERKYLFSVKRFGKIDSGFSYKRKNVDAISFECSEDISLKGIFIYGTDQGPGDLGLNVRLVQEPYGANLTNKQAPLECDGKQKEYSFMFDEPQTIKKGKKYTVAVTIEGPTTFFGNEGVEEVMTERVKFTFSRSAKSTNTTCPEWGQIPGLIFELPSANTDIEPMET
ncbi:BTB/POZ domain-containing protein 2-like [Mya arenaria]|uniref:BTB/POZ domain-containing protein 2-like n=1 Tax=Mya arenaria TaxID=6604 RepID=UPI0022E31572|nr:BTB/POZ domain-containing protein 2-like [Mya arenaria]